MIQASRPSLFWSRASESTVTLVVAGILPVMLALAAFVYLMTKDIRATKEAHLLDAA